MSNFIYLGKIIELAKKGEEPPKFKVELLMEGKYLHPQAPGGVLNLGRPVLKEIHDNFKAGVRGDAIPSNIGHDDTLCKDSPAWVEEMVLEDGPDGKAHLYGIGEINDPKLYEKVEQRRVRYVSPELDLAHVDVKDGVAKKVMKSFAFTNMPHIKGMKAIAINFEEVMLNEDSEAQDTFEDKQDDPQKSLSDALDGDAKADDLPDQCRSCNKLFLGHCPFRGIELKEAAAQGGMCPQYEDRGVLKAKQTSGDDGGSEANMGDNPNTKVISLEEWNQLQETLKGIPTLTAALEEAKTKAAETISLSEVVKAQEAIIVELKEHNAQAADAQTIMTHVDAGRLTAAGAKLYTRILELGRGKTGIMLSDDKTEATLPALLEELLETIEPNVSLEELTRAGDVAVHQPRQAANDPENVTLSEKAVTMATEKAKATGRDFGEVYKETLVELTRPGGK